MRILFVASEANPLAKVGGLADVVGSLPGALRETGQDVRIIIPQYGSLDTHRFPPAPVKTGLRLSFGGLTETFNLNLTHWNGTPIYLLENQKYFGIPDIYTSNDLERFYFFSRAVFELLPDLDWQPEIVHCHDWLTSLVPGWLKKSGYPCASVFTIHNLAYQGRFDDNFMNRFDLKNGEDYLPPDAPNPPHSFMSQAILWADMITAVSETYAREITTPENGMGLDALLRYRGDSLTGIVNGLDTKEWDPLTDRYLPVNYDSNSLQKRVFNKYALQKVSGLPVNADIPLIGMVQRLDEQKGIDLLGQAIEEILKQTGAQLVVLGRGRENYENLLRWNASRFPRQVAAFVAFEEPLAHLIYSGCDMFLMPSLFEPCGLGQIIAMRYGALPVVRHTGGLVDTVPGYNSDLTQGNGFIFHDYRPEALLKAVREAVTAFKDAWNRAVRRVSRLDFSWQSSARQYESIYQKVLKKAGK
jgi:starch synthase